MPLVYNAATGKLLHTVGNRPSHACPTPTGPTPCFCGTTGGVQIPCAVDVFFGGVAWCGSPCYSPGPPTDSVSERVSGAGAINSVFRVPLTPLPGFPCTYMVQASIPPVLVELFGDAFQPANTNCSAPPRWSCTMTILEVILQARSNFGQVSWVLSAGLNNNLTQACTPPIFPGQAVGRRGFAPFASSRLVTGGNPSPLGFYFNDGTCVGRGYQGGVAQVIAAAANRPADPGIGPEDT